MTPNVAIVAQLVTQTLTKIAHPVPSALRKGLWSLNVHTGCSRPDTIWHVVRRERTVHPLCQGSVLQIVARRQCDIEEIVHHAHARHPPRRRGRLRALVLARHRAGERHLAADDLDLDVCRVDEPVGLEL
jgi:hypothetical protein